LTRLNRRCSGCRSVPQLSVPTVGLYWRHHRCAELERGDRLGQGGCSNAEPWAL